MLRSATRCSSYCPYLFLTGGHKCIGARIHPFSSFHEPTSEVLFVYRNQSSSLSHLLHLPGGRIDNWEIRWARDYWKACDDECYPKFAPSSHGSGPLCKLKGHWLPAGMHVDRQGAGFFLLFLDRHRCLRATGRVGVDTDQIGGRVCLRFSRTRPGWGRERLVGSAGGQTED